MMRALKPKMIQRSMKTDSLEKAISALMGTCSRIAITGAPLTGKTTLAKSVTESKSIPVIHGDDYIELGWSESSKAIADAVNAIDGAVIVEGVQVARAIRKGMCIDALLYLSEPFEPLNKGQVSMAKGVETVLFDCQDKGLLDSVEVVSL